VTALQGGTPAASAADGPKLRVAFTKQKLVGPALKAVGVTAKTTDRTIEADGACTSTLGCRDVGNGRSNKRARRSAALNVAGRMVARVITATVDEMVVDEMLRAEVRSLEENIGAINHSLRHVCASMSYSKLLRTCRDQNLDYSSARASPFLSARYTRAKTGKDPLIELLIRGAPKMPPPARGDPLPLQDADYN